MRMVHSGEVPLHVSQHHSKSFSFHYAIAEIPTMPLIQHVATSPDSGFGGGGCLRSFQFMQAQENQAKW